MLYARTVLCKKKSAVRDNVYIGNSKVGNIYIVMADCNFYDDCQPWTPKNNEYPTWDSAVRFYMCQEQIKRFQLKLF